MCVTSGLSAQFPAQDSAEFWHGARLCTTQDGELQQPGTLRDHSELSPGPQAINK